MRVAVWAGFGLIRWRVVALVAAMNGQHAHPHTAHAHGGLPSPIVVDRRVGPYVASVWSNRAIGMGTFYVVLKAADGMAFTQPSAVRVAVAPASGRGAEIVYEAHPERVRRGARFITEADFDHADRWNVRVMIEGPAGGGQLASYVDVTADATSGSLVLVLYSLPFVLMALVWWRAAVARRRLSATVVESARSRTVD